MTRPALPLLLRLELRIPPDSSWWARSLTWSCGRPGYTPRFDFASSWEASIRAEYARYWVGAAVLRADRIDLLPITGIA